MARYRELVEEAWRWLPPKKPNEYSSRRANFTARPSLESYIALHDAAGEQFPAWRERAIVVLRKHPAATARFADARPADAIPILVSAANQSIGYKKRGSYQVAAGLLTEAGALFARCDRVADFESHLAALRTTHRQKRAFREELDRAGLP